MAAHHHRIRSAARAAYQTSERHFDEDGLWSYKSARFSIYGTLLATAEAIVVESDLGCFVDELDNRLHAGTKDALRKLVRDGRLCREKVEGRYLYCPAEPHMRRQQVLARRTHAERTMGGPLPEPDAMHDELKAAIILFFSLINEKQRRLYAGLESLKLGHGGDRRMATLLGMGKGAVARGRCELLDRDVEVDRIRKAGAGRKPVKKTPEVIDRIAKMVKNETAGDPMTGLKWTHKTTARIAGELRTLVIDISPNTVGRLLNQMGYSLRVNSKKLSRVSKVAPADRDAQFSHIAALREDFAAQGLPVISVDTKKKELLGLFKNPGHAWRSEPIKVKDHDFASEADGKAVPYGIYDIHANLGTMFVGTSRDTSEFAVDCIEAWWRDEGQGRYPGAKRLVILADGGGSNGSRSRAWKLLLQNQLCKNHGLTVTVAHYPPGTSKWNPIEHRLFSEISKNWAGRPLDTYETVLNYMRTTKTAAGLEVHAQLVPKKYEAGLGPPKMAKL